MNEQYVPGEEKKETSPAKGLESDAVLLDPLSALKIQTEKEKKTLESLSEQTEEQIVAQIKKSLKYSDNPYENEIDHSEMIVVEEKDILDDDMQKNKELRTIRQSIVYDPDKEDLFLDFTSSSSEHEEERGTQIIGQGQGSEPKILEEEMKEQKEQEEAQIKQKIEEERYNLNQMGHIKSKECKQLRKQQIFGLNTTTSDKPENSAFNVLFGEKLVYHFDKSIICEHNF